MYELNKKTLELLKQERNYQGDMINQDYYITKMTEELIYRFWEANKEEINNYDDYLNREDLGLTLEYIVREFFNNFRPKLNL